MFMEGEFSPKWLSPHRIYRYSSAYGFHSLNQREMTVITLWILLASCCILELPAFSILRPSGLRSTYLNVVEQSSHVRYWPRSQTSLWSSSSTDLGSKRPFDPIEDDPRLNALYLSEIKAIRSTMTTIDMKNELSSTGNPCKSVLDKAELEKLLARRRILFRMQNAQQTDMDLKNKQLRAERIDNEIYQITRVTRMSEIAMVRELQSLQCKVDVNGNLAQQLAVARLGLHRRSDHKSDQVTTSDTFDRTSKATTGRPQANDRSTMENENIIQDEDEEVTLGDEMKGIYHQIRNTFDEAVGDMVGDVNLDDLNPINILGDVIKHPENLNPLRDINVFDMVANTTLGQRVNVTAAATFSKGFINGVGLTKAEQRAQQVIAQQSQEDGGMFGDGQSTPGQSRMEWNVTTAQEQLALLMDDEVFQKASPEVAFDMVLQWSRPLSRTLLASLLTTRGESIPRYATRSDLAAVLADSVLVERCGAYYCDVEIDDFENSIVGNRKKQQLQQQQLLQQESSSPRPSRRSSDAQFAAFNRDDDTISTKKERKGSSSFENVNHDVSNGNRMRSSSPPSSSSANRNRQSRPQPMDAFFFEKDLFNKAINGVSRAFRAFLDTTNAIDQLFDFQMNLWSTLVRFTVFGVKSVRTLALWAGGDLLPPTQVVFAITAYCLIARKGVLSFLGSFAVLRLFRELALLQGLGGRTREDNDRNMRYKYAGSGDGGSSGGGGRVDWARSAGRKDTGDDSERKGSESMDKMDDEDGKDINDGETKDNDQDMEVSNTIRSQEKKKEEKDGKEGRIESKSAESKS